MFYVREDLDENFDLDFETIKQKLLQNLEGEESAKDWEDFTKITIPREEEESE